jgi:hypothetical protein
MDVGKLAFMHIIVEFHQSDVFKLNTIIKNLDQQDRLLCGKKFIFKKCDGGSGNTARRTKFQVFIFLIAMGLLMCGIPQKLCVLYVIKNMKKLAFAYDNIYGDIIEFLEPIRKTEFTQFKIHLNLRDLRQKLDRAWMDYRDLDARAPKRGRKKKFTK